ncbi:hypothetical protein GGE12_001849 [Rhizobium mongolense]|uniref:Uncharacterized protein n=1 Tax=Rhizobium mongolense TaxID=57676 RepID=A0A7W6RKS1_9HYPH|nr:hypothetical protein [Rhizobium mongolense]
MKFATTLQDHIDLETRIFAGYRLGDCVQRSCRAV